MSDSTIDRKLCLRRFATEKWRPVPKVLGLGLQPKRIGEDFNRDLKDITSECLGEAYDDEVFEGVSRTIFRIPSWS